MIDIIIPAYNASGTLPRAIDSIVRQSSPDWSAVIVDDGSDPHHGYESLARIDPRIRLIRQENGGPAVARNLGILRSRAPYIALLDADDSWQPTKLERQLASLEANPQAVLCYSDYSRGPSSPSTISRLSAYQPRTPGREFHDLLRENFVATSSVVIRRSALARSGLFDPQLRGPEDLDLWLRLAHIGPFCFVDEVLMHKGDHAGNLSASLGFVRAQLSMLGAWRDRTRGDRLAQSLIRAKLRSVCHSRAYAAKQQGLFREARQSYWACARMGIRPLRSITAALSLTRPDSIRHQHQLFGSRDPSESTSNRGGIRHAQAR